MCLLKKSFSITVLLLCTAISIFAQSPGGKSSNLTFWVKSDTGVTGTTSVTQWNDQSTNSFNLTATTTPSKIDNGVNFNPVINFNGTDQYMQVTSGIIGTNTYSNVWVYVVGGSTTIKDSSIFHEDLDSGERLGAHLPWGDSDAYFDFGLCCTTSRINTPFGSFANVYNLWTLSSSTGTSTPTGSRKNISRDGLSIAVNNNNNSGNSRTGVNNNFFVGAENASSLFYAGNIAEIIIYTDAPSAAEQQRIQSYLALKYGITLNSTDNIVSITEGDYILSDGTTKVWDFTTNSLYHHDVTAIGKDTTSGLDQKQSKSVNSDAIVTIGLGSIETTNAANSNLFTTDKDFLVWGNDNGSTALQTTERPATAISENRLGREWKVSENGSISNLTIAFSGIPTDATNIELYVDTDGDGDFTNASIITGGSILSGSAIFSGIDLNNNDVFTLGYSTINTHPGGVSTNLGLWLKANEGVTGTTSVTQWNDYSGNNKTATASTAPSKIDAAVNYNPSISFNGTNQFMEVGSGLFGTSTYNDMWVYIVESSRAIQNSSIFQENLTSGEIFGPHLPWADSNVYFDFGLCCTTSRINTNWGTSVDVYNLWTMSSSTGTSTPTGSRKNISRNGLSIVTSNNNNTADSRTGNNSSMFIGSPDGSTNFHPGDIAEMIFYTGIPSAAEQQRVQSYLALKYGITLDATDNIASIIEGDYVLSDGTTKVWDYTANTTYHNDVAAIGLDEASNLNQKQSKSINSDAIVAMGIGGIAVTNDANINTFSTDKDFIVWGNDNGSTATQTSELPATATAVNRLGREWKVSENGSINNLTILFNVAQTNLVNIELYVDTDGDGDFTNATVISGGSIIDGKVAFTGVDLNNNDVFTLGYTIFTGIPGHLGPGGVGSTDGTTALKSWFIAEKETGSPTTWQDLSGNSGNATVASGQTAPTLETGTLNSYNTFNFSSNQFQFNRSVTNNYTLFCTFLTSTTGAGTTQWWQGLGLLDAEVSGVSPDFGVSFSSNSSVMSGLYTGSSDLTIFSSTSSLNNGLSHIAYTARSTSGTGTLSLIVDEDSPVNATNTGTAARTTSRITIGSLQENINYFTGKIPEVIAFDQVVNTAQRIIINNYLSAKYNVVLSANDFYNEDDNGDFDHQVAGIGQATDGTNHQDSQGTGIVRINTPSGLGNDEYLFWGRNNKTAITIATSPVYTERLSTNWRVSKRNDLGTVTVDIDLTGIDISGKQSCAPLKLIVDNDSDLASPTATYNLTNITGNIYRATTVSFSDNDYFTVEYVDKIVVDGTQFYNGSGATNVPNTSDNCFKLLVKNTANGTLSLTENADVREVEVETGGKLAVNSGTRLQITNGITLNGEIRLLGTSQLIQTHTGIKEVTGTGNLYKDKKGVLTNIYQSGYWTSPVTTNGTTFTIEGVVKDGTTPTSISSTPPNITFTPTNIYDGDNSTSPVTVSGKWLAKLINATDWTREISPTTETFNPGEGWNMKSTGNATGQNYSFVGIPNDGTYTSTIESGRLSLLGNPYPSAFDVDQFITDNTSAISGTLYFYEAGNDTSHTRGSYTGGYGTRVSGVGTPASGSSKTPGKYVDVGQAFFVTRDAAGSGFVSFQNSQRSFQTSAEFFSKTSENKSTTANFPIIRLGFEFNIGNNETFKRIIAVAFRGLTDDYEMGYDAEMFDRHPTDIALKVNNRTTPFVITSINNYRETKEIPLQVFVDETKEVTFSVEDVKNLTSTIYIKDAVTNTYYDITNQPQTITLDAGTYSYRFSMVFIKVDNNSLNIENIEAEKTVIYVNNKSKNIVIQSEAKFLEAKLYTLLGQEITEWKGISEQLKNKLPLPNLKPSMYLLKVKTNKGFVFKKLVIK